MEIIIGALVSLGVALALGALVGYLAGFQQGRALERMKVRRPHVQRAQGKVGRYGR